MLKKMSPGMTVFDVKKATGSVWPVKIKEIDLENERVFASWNGNEPEWFARKVWSKWRLKRPQIEI